MIIYRSLKRLQIWMFRSLLSATMRSIGTHNGVFHCDEALACAILRSLPDFKESVIVRTRDPKLLEPCDVVVDVGGVFDHDKKRWFYRLSLTLGNWSTKILNLINRDYDINWNPELSNNNTNTRICARW